VTGEVQSTLEFFNEVPQTYFCEKCREFHKVGQCREVNKDGQ
jgi:hypothetical protein